MAALTAGVQYSLSSNQNNNGLMSKQRTSKNKTLFFVKLTDSCLKAVEDYLRCCQQVSRGECCLGLDFRFSDPFREGLSFFLIICPLPSVRCPRVISRPFKRNLVFFLATSSIQTFFIPASSFLVRPAESLLGFLCLHPSAQPAYRT